MKKILALILVMTAVLCLALASCTAEKNDNEKNKENSVFQIESSPVYEYNAELEAIVDEVEPKGDIDKEILGSIDGLPISAASVKYAASYTAYSEDQGVTGEDLENLATDAYKELATTIKLAHKYGIKADDTLKDWVSTSYSTMKEYFDASSDVSYEEYFEELPYSPFFYHYQTLAFQYLYQQIYNEYCKDEEVIAEASENAITFYNENDYVRAKHILIKFPEGEGEDGALTDAQKAETLAKAEAVLAEVNAMSDISEFDALIEKYNEDPGMQANPDGYYFTKGNMVPEFEETAYSLAEGETSGLVKVESTNYSGYHILLKLPIDDKEAIVNTEKYAEFTTEAFYDMFDETFKQEAEIVYADNYDERFEQFKAEYREIMEKQEAEAQAQAEASSANLTEAE